MAEINYTASTPKKSYTRRIGDNGFLGADFSTAPIFASDRRFRDLKNVWKDYKSGSGVAIETIPGYRALEKYVLTGTPTPPVNINGIYRFDVTEDNWLNFAPAYRVDLSGTWYIVHYGKRLACFREVDDNSEKPYVVCNRIGMEFNVDILPNKRSFSIQVGDKLIIYCGNAIYWLRVTMDSDWGEDVTRYESVNQVFCATECSSSYYGEGGFYVPTTYIDGHPYEQKNMLSLVSREYYHETGASITIYPHEKIISDTDFPKYNIIDFNVDGVDKTDSISIVRSVDDNIVSISVGSLSSGNHTVEFVYRSDATKFTSYQSVEEYKGKTTFKEGNPDYSGTAYDAIAGCTICASFDDRVFLAGNPKLPNTVFYSQRDLTGYNNPTYFGVLNYNNLGTSNAPIKAMIPSATSLCVLKDDSATDPTMYFLTGVTTEHDLIPRVYTVESGLPGIGCKGAACNFLDDIVFMSRNGVIGIDKQAVNLERTLGDRSALINGKLLLEDVTQAIFAEAEGYLWCLFTNNGHLYLADSRAYTQGAGYEWYFIDSVGSWASTLANPEVDYLQYKDDIVGDEESVTIYDEDDTEHLTPYVVLPRHTDGAQALDEYGNPIESNATYTVNPDGVTHDIILVENPDPNHTGTYFQVEKTGEKVGGTFHPATCMVASNDRIFFGTDNGDLLTFNNDKRGERAVSEDETEPNRYPFMLRPEWYSFCGHRIESFVETSDDDGGIGNLTKDTVRRSCVVDMKAMLGSKYKITTYTDRDGWKNDNAATGSMNDASQTMLDAVNFSGDEHINVQIRERARKWVHKRYRIESNGFCSPFGLYRITYDFEINGRIK